MREAAAEERFEEAARYRNRLFAVQHLAERQAADKRGGRRRRRDRRRGRGRPRGGAGLPAARAARWSTATRFHLENVERAGRGDGAGGVLPRVLRLGAGGPAADRRAAGAGRPVARSRSSSPSGAARASRCARPSAARSGGCRSSRAERAARARVGRRAETEQRRLRRVEALEELREALNLEALPIRIECFDISNIQGSRSSARWSSSRTRTPKKAHYRKFGVRGLDGPGRLRGDGARWSRAASRGSRGTGGRGVRRVLRRGAEPRRDRRRQGPARRRRSRRCRRSTCRASP